MAGENLDISSDPHPVPPQKSASEARRFVGMRFDCCDVYTRIYVNREGTAYEGKCPRCFRQVRLEVGPGGTDQRFFTAY